MNLTRLLFVALLALWMASDVASSQRVMVRSVARGVSGSSAFPSQSACPDPNDDSPTGRNPLFSSCAGTENLKQMWADYQANTSNPATTGGQFMKQMVDRCNTMPAPPNANSAGYECVVPWLASGTTTYASKTWDALNATAGNGGFLTLTPPYPSGSNTSRQFMLRAVVWYDALYVWLNASQRTTFESELHEMLNWILVSSNDRLEDSDQVVGNYCGALAANLLMGSTNSSIATEWNRAIVGGLTATAENFSSTYRNAYKYLHTLAAGGEWVESGEYNNHTLSIKLLCDGVIRNAGVEGNFSEIATLLTPSALRDIYFTTPGATQRYQWGDEENPRSFRAGIDVMEADGYYAFLMEGTGNGPYIFDYIKDIIAQYGHGTDRNNDAAIHRDAMILGPNFNQTRGDTTTLPKNFYASGQGFNIYRDGWASTDAAFFSHCLNTTRFVDHQIVYWCNFVLWRDGEWAFTYPMSYAGASLYGDGANTMSFVNYPHNFSHAGEYRKVAAQDSGTGPDYSYIKATAGGAIQGSTSFFQPPTWKHEQTRSILALPSSNKASFTMVVFDRTNIQDPRTLADFWMYDNLYGAATVDTYIDPATKLSEQFWHIPAASPSCSGAQCTWTTTNNSLELNTLLPTSISRSVVDEDTLTDDRWDVNTTAGERLYHLKISKSTETQFQTWLTVIRAHDALTLAAPTLIDDAENIQGALIQTPSLDDVVVLFNSTQGSNVSTPYAAGNATTLDNVTWRTTGFAVTWTSVASSTDLFLMDLKPSQTWTCQIDGGATFDCAENAAGIARKLDIAGSGSHTVTVTTP